MKLRGKDVPGVKQRMRNGHIIGTLEVGRFGQNVGQLRLRRYIYGPVKHWDDDCACRKVLEMHLSGQENGEDQRGCVWMW